MKKKINYKLPILNDKNGNISEKWYVEYSYRYNVFGKYHRFRVCNGLTDGTAKQRYANAKKIIAEKTAFLTSGAYLEKAPKHQYFDIVSYKRKQRKQTGTVGCLKKNISDYLANKKSVLATKTFQAYTTKLRLFFQWAEKEKGSDVETNKITRKDISDFCLYLAKQELSKVTVKGYILAIHTFFEYEISREVLTENPANKIKPIGKIKDFAAQPLTNNDIEALKQYLQKNNPQIMLACELIYYCAIRPSYELRFLKLADIDFRNCNLRITAVNAKNNLTEIIKVPQHIIEKLQCLGYEKLPRNYYLFGKNGTPSEHHYSINAMRTQFNEARDTLNLPKEIKFYSWKHTGIITALNNGMHPFEIQAHCRHKDFATTEKYIKKRTKLPKDNSHFFGMI